MNHNLQEPSPGPVKPKTFSRAIFLTRNIGLSVAVVFTLISAIFLFVVGVYNVIQTIVTFLSDRLIKGVLSGLIKTMDIFLAALVMIFLAVGLYELFTVGAREANADTCQIWNDFSSTLDQLKSSLAKLVIIILIITFLELVLASVGEFTGYQLLIVPTGICMIALSLRWIK